MNYTVYKTNRQATKCVKYWDKVFRETLFFDWQVTYASVEYHIPLIQKELSLSKREARNLVWSAYCDAVTGNVESPFFEEYDQFCTAVTEDLIPFFSLVKCIGVDIHGGILNAKQSKSSRMVVRRSTKWCLWKLSNQSRPFN